MAFIYNLTDTWNDAATTWNGIKLAVTNSGSDASSKLLNLTVTGATTASFVVDKSGNLALNGTVNKITFTAPATGAILTLADNSTFITSGAYSSTFTFTGATTLTFPTSGTVTALGNTTTGSGSIVLATSPTLVTPALGTPISGNLTNCTGYQFSNLSGTVSIANGGTGQTTANAAFNALAPSQTGNNGKYLTTDGTNTSWATNPLGTVTSVDVSGGTTGISFSGGPITTSGTITMSGTLAVANGGTGITSFGTGVATALGVNVGSAGAFVVNGGALGTPSSGTLTNATGLPISTGVSGLGTGVATFLATPSSANLASAVTDETGSGPLVFATSPTFTSQVTLGTQGTTQGSLVLANTASTYATTIKSSNSATAAYTLTLPTTAGTNGYFLQTDGVGNLSWAAGGGGGGGSVAGSDKQIQFNDAGSFGASANFLFDKTTYTMTLGLASTATGVLALGNASSANLTKIRAGNASVAVTYTLPTADGTNGQALITNGSGALSWTTIASGLTVGSTAISGGTSGRILYDNAGVLGELATTGSGNVVLATSPTLVTPLLGTPTSGTLTNCTGLPVSTGISGLGTGVATALGNNTNIAGGVLVPVAALTANALVVGGGSGTGPSTVTTGTGVVTALGVNTGTAGAFVVNGGALGTPSSGTLTNCTGIPAAGITGTLGVANGGTGLTSLTAGYIPYGNGTSAFGSSSNFTFNGTTDLIVPKEIYSSTATDYIRMAGGNPNANGAYFLLFGQSHATAPGRLSLRAAGSGDAQYVTDTGVHVWFTSGSSERMRIDSSGNVGIGTTSPSAKLHVSTSSASAYGAIIYNTSSTGNGLTVRGGSTSSHSSMVIQNYDGSNSALEVQGSGNVIIGSAAIATTATDGFLYVPTCAGTPTGTPTTYTGRAPIVVNTTNNKLYFYSGGAWRDAGP